MSQGAITIAFPDVCKTPAPAGPIPIPYPNIAQTATKNAAKVKIAGKTTSPAGSTSRGGEPGTLKGMISSRNMARTSYPAGSAQVKFEGANVQRAFQPTVSNQALSEAQQLCGTMNALNQQLQTLPSGTNTDRWQALLQEYAVCASALYWTLLPHED